MKIITTTAILVSLALVAGSTMALDTRSGLPTDDLLTLEASTKDYVAVGGDAIVACDAEDVLGFCLGGAIFGLELGTYSITIDDDLNGPVAFSYSADGGPFEFRCGSVEGVYVENSLEVFIDTAFALAVPSCPNTDSFGTTGKIIVS
jgi:hypothetical protein